MLNFHGKTLKAAFSLFIFLESIPFQRSLAFHPFWDGKKLQEAFAMATNDVTLHLP